MVLFDGDCCFTVRDQFSVLLAFFFVCGEVGAAGGGVTMVVRVVVRAWSCEGGDVRMAVVVK